MNRQYESVAALAAAAARDPELQEELKSDPVGTLKAVEEPAYRADKWLTVLPLFRCAVHL